MLFRGSLPLSASISPRTRLARSDAEMVTRIKVALPSSYSPLSAAPKKSVGVNWITIIPGGWAYSSEFIAATAYGRRSRQNAYAHVLR
jgi:hypothetical protein